MTLEWHSINIEVPNKNTSIKQPHLDLIKNGSGTIKHGEILAIMGPSGGGKTTLLNALAGRIPHGSITQGTILYNNVQRDKREWFHLAGFVDQDDVVHEELTVMETLRYAARFRLKNCGDEGEVCYESEMLGEDSDNNLDNLDNNNNINVVNRKRSVALKDKSKKPMRPIDCEARIEQIVRDLSLQRCANNMMSKVSGGERKRAMIGIELITDPDIIFLDEPTSGLDTFTALKIIKILRRLASEEGKIVCLTIHQPSSEIFGLFDSLLLLSHGNTIYSGKITDVEKFFNSRNMIKRDLITYPEFIVEVCSEDYQTENPSLFYAETSIFKENVVFKDKKIRKKKNDFYINFKPNYDHVVLLLKRKLRIDMHRKMKFAKTFAFKMTSYLMMLFFNYQSYKMLMNNPGMLFGDMNMGRMSSQDVQYLKPMIIHMARAFISCSILFMLLFLQVSSSISSFFDENKLVRREIAVESYSTTSYYLSLLIYTMCSELLAPIIILILFYIFLNDIFDITTVLLFLTSSFFTVSFGIAIGSISRTKSIVIILSSIFGSISSIPTNTIATGLLKFGLDSNGRKTLICGASYLTLLITPYYFTTFMSYLIYWRGYRDIKDNQLFSMFIPIFEGLMKTQKSYVGMKEMNAMLVLVLLIGSPFMCLMFGVYCLGLNLMPDIRMRLEKDHVDKTK